MIEKSFGTSRSARLVLGLVCLAAVLLLPTAALAVKRGDTFTGVITGLGSIANRTKLWFAFKRSHHDADTAALVLIEETDGLVYLDGAAATSGQGSITVDDEDAGNVTVVIDEAATAVLTEGARPYDIQVLRSTGNVNTLAEGTATVSADVTRAIT